MKKGIGQAIAAWCVVCVVVAAPAAARAAAKRVAETSRSGATLSANTQTGRDPMLQEMEKLTAPGPQHHNLESLAGRWTTRTRVWENPEAKPLEFPGGAEYHMILGGRFLQVESRSLFNGNETHGLGLYGYDNIKEKYSLYFIHDAETQALVGLGDGDSTGTSITFDVTMDMPASGETAKPIRTVLRRLGPDRHVFEMFEKYMDGREWKVIEVTYDRAK